MHCTDPFVSKGSASRNHNYCRVGPSVHKFYNSLSIRRGAPSGYWTSQSILRRVAPMALVRIKIGVLLTPNMRRVVLHRNKGEAVAAVFVRINELVLFVALIAPCGTHHKRSFSPDLDMPISELVLNISIDVLYGCRWYFDWNALVLFTVKRSNGNPKK